MKLGAFSRMFTGVSVLALGAILLGMATSVAAQDGLVTRAAAWLWPQVEARITVQTAALSPLGSASLAGAPTLGGAARGVQGGGVFGDYVITRRAFGSLRATSGLMLGSWIAAPGRAYSVGNHLGLTVLDSSDSTTVPVDLSAMPYVGLGYNSPPLWRALSVTADVGLVSGWPASLASMSRALSYGQAADPSLHDARVGPVVRLGVRYAF